MVAKGLKLARLIVNLKNYPETLGTKAVRLARDTLQISTDLGVPIALCPQAVDVRHVAETGIIVYAQHFDRVDKPESTGWGRLESLIEAGAMGSLVNHSEHRLAPADITAAVETLRKASVVSILCTKDSEESGALAATRPSLLAVEPPELIGGNVSVTTADPGVVRRSVDAVRRVASGTPVLCGAGVKAGRDVTKALELGAYGILVASGVTKAKDPAKALRGLAEGFRAAD